MAWHDKPPLGYQPPLTGANYPHKSPRFNLPWPPPIPAQRELSWEERMEAVSRRCEGDRQLAKGRYRELGDKMESLEERDSGWSFNPLSDDEKKHLEWIYDERRRIRKEHPSIDPR